MEIKEFQDQDKNTWNQFVINNFPPVGAFMQSWEWGEFQKNLGRKVQRYFVSDKEERFAVFTLVHHSLPLKFSYGYIPRGPVISSHIQEERKPLEIFKIIKDWALKNFPHFVFMRLEPPLNSIAPDIRNHGFHIPSYYTQPRYNLTISLDQPLETVKAHFHPSTRSNIHRAENRGVSVELKEQITDADYNQFFNMIQETIQRNKGKDAYPNQSYFRSLVTTIPSVVKTEGSQNLSLGIFYGYQNAKPAAMHFVLFFGNTATYLFGASYSDCLRSKVTTYLHWIAMQEAKKRGLLFYDLGGIDEARWPTLTNFKKQFRGQEFHYIGNVDISLRPFTHQIYNLFRKFKEG